MGGSSTGCIIRFRFGNTSARQKTKAKVALLEFGAVPSGRLHERYSIVATDVGFNGCVFVVQAELKVIHKHYVHLFSGGGSNGQDITREDKTKSLASLPRSQSQGQKEGRIRAVAPLPKHETTTKTTGGRRVSGCRGWHPPPHQL